ncbi:TfoX/Sxy family protein [Sinorhizobium americanum]|uniref:Regulator protein of competence-specific n=1 Tax=Sinorhizobium americanum TaxID=194963 RepID=A0A1L3LM67_9HYPH|nr:TfoX/Sxy family protein [Sinorhizobium americanum]APG84547.1 regulator protein of competence-specific [Sinorhizobium americanum CCGM7]APG91202.1 regulator protein of competence-specific [Sinorhizobium americanum]OAP45219.1 competence protein TfoX [Sinorhizobium americanum]
MDNGAIEEMFQALGPISIRRMFGGKGIYCDGVILAVEVDGEILLKGDAETALQLEEAGARQWAYDGKGKPVKMPYWSIPDSAYDDPDEMARWVKLAYSAALRAKK